MSATKYLPELLEANVITPETAERIETYYREKQSRSGNRLFTVFGILGALLVGLGIILIIAHNWDDLSIPVKTFFAFLPLLIGQSFCGFVLIRRPDAVALSESGATFLFLSVGACISLISQIYNIPGDLSAFMLTWSVLCLPIIYLMQSSIASLLFICAITVYATNTGYMRYPEEQPYLYWPLLFSVLPHYYFNLMRKRPNSNFSTFHNWFIPLSLIIVLGAFADGLGEWLYIGYVSLFGLFLLVGNLPSLTEQRGYTNGYQILGFLGTVILLLTLSFDGFWKELRHKAYNSNDVVTSSEFLTSALITFAAIAILVLQYQKKVITGFRPLEIFFLVFLLTFLAGLLSPIPVVLVNLYVLSLGIWIVREGSRRDHLGILNYGLLIIAVLVICRFFDTDLSFVVRGVLFVAVGIGFFATNYWMIKKRKNA